MAFSGTITYRGAVTLGGSSSSGSFSSFTPAVDDLLIVYAYHTETANVSTTAVTASAYGITFSQITGSPFANTDSRDLEVFIGRVSSASADTVDITRSNVYGVSQYRCIQISGAKDDGTPESAIAQSLFNDAYEGGDRNGQELTIGTYASSMESDSVSIVCGAFNNTGMSWITPTGYTVISNSEYFQLVETDSGDTTPNVEFGSLPATYLYMSGLALEISAAAGAPATGGYTSALTLMGVG